MPSEHPLPLYTLDPDDFDVIPGSLDFAACVDEPLIRLSGGNNARTEILRELERAITVFPEPWERDYSGPPRAENSDTWIAARMAWWRTASADEKSARSDEQGHRNRIAAALLPIAAANHRNQQIPSVADVLTVMQLGNVTQENAVRLMGGTN
jgi:hypothetical protein